jgi:RNA polymerase sigma-70 factor (ECF subfamily)
VRPPIVFTASTSFTHDEAVADETDLELVRRFREGDRGAFERLVVRHRPWVQRVCARLLRSDASANDAAQDVFTRAFERIESQRGENVAGWLKAIAVNTCLNTIDREKRWAPLEDAGEPRAADPQPDQRLLRAERLAHARRLIARLPQKQKIVFCMKYIDECSYEEIERLTGFSNKEVKSFLQNARRNVENWWREEQEGTRG